jgi:para-nitrobenzyl esterase
MQSILSPTSRRLRLVARLAATLAALVATTASIANSAAVPAPGNGTLVSTELGRLRGVERHGVIEFRGIPYAAPPVGKLRWHAPQPATAWTGVRSATEFGSACPQLHRFNLTDESLDEDCLTLNVSMPVASDPTAGKPRPVLVWIHGGAFVGGSSDLYRLDKLARAGHLVVVSINYRLGVLGFMPHPSFPGDDNGAYGLLDQRAALGWVRRNAAAFGGDPDNVTVAGESAGGGSICMHLANPDATRGLFQKAIVISAGCMQPMPTVAESGAQVGQAVASAVGCGDPATALDCLRHAPVRALLEAGDVVSRMRIMTFSPTIGSSAVPRQAADALRAGEFLAVPTLMGGARDELRLYLGYDEQAGRHVTADNYAEKLGGYYGKFAAQVVAAYPLPAGASPPATVGSVLSDYNPFVGINNCLYLQTATTLARRTTVYEFEFSDPNALVVGVGIARPDPGFPLGAVHSSALNYLFPHMSNTAKINAPDLPATSERLSDDMVALSAGFAGRGAPSAPGLPAWPRFAPGATVMRLEPGRTGVFDASQAHQCRFWQSLYPDALDALAPGTAP